MAKINIKSLVSISTSLAIFVVVVATTLAIRMGHVKSFLQPGFFCDDKSIHYPLKEETVPTTILVVVGSILVLVIAVITEYFHISSNVVNVGKCCRSQLSVWCSNALIVFFLYLFGFCTTILFVEIGKVSTGVLRPNFFAMCRPNINCSNVENVREYHTEFECLNGDENDREDAARSFPSGHAAAVAFMAFYVCIYLHQRPKAFHSCFLLKAFLQLVIMALAWVTSLTRISDHVHHVSDVIVGFALGAFGAMWALNVATDMMDTQNTMPNTSIEAHHWVENVENTTHRPLEMNQKDIPHCK